MEKECLECGDSIFGRVDKKFCCDQCRNSYNNKLNSDSTDYIRNTNNILRRNRRILEQLTPNEKAKTTRDKLVEKGFNFNYHTSTYTTKDNRTYFYCYDFGYLELDKGWFALVKKKEWN